MGSVASLESEFCRVLGGNDNNEYLNTIDNVLSICPIIVLQFHFFLEV